MKKECRELDLNQGFIDEQTDASEGMAIFNEIIQHLLHSKVAKAESYLIGGYHNE